MDRFMPFLATQIWFLPYLALFILGVVFALGRRDMGNASQYAVFGFGLMILGLMLSSANMYFMIARAGSDNMSAVARHAALFHAGTMVLNFGGWGFILAAIFAKRPPPPSRVE